MTREGRRQLAEETLSILQNKEYLLLGQRVQIRDSIEKSERGTVLYRTSPLFERIHADSLIEVTTESTVSALQRLQGEGNLAALNFASARRPGGGFLSGAQAQEESLARSSALYSSLIKEESFYQIHANEASPFYSDIAIWSPSVVFFRSASDQLTAPFYSGIITCAAPDLRTMAEEHKVHLKTRLLDRITLILSVAAHHKVDTLVLGAWGCGVFRNDPKMVAEAFRTALENEFQGQFRKIVFAIYCPQGPNETSAAFDQAFRRAV